MTDSLTGADASEVERIVARYRAPLAAGMRRAVERAWAQLAPAPESAALVEEFEGQIEYHLGWRHPDLSRARSHPGKLLRPALLLLACELAAGTRGAAADERARLARRAVPAAVCIELVHNFSLIHDDIEDGDDERRHRPTLWKLWGVPQAINAGDALFSLARTGLWQLVDVGVSPRVVVALAALLDRTCLDLCAGQFLDMRFERRRDVTVAMYMEMIERKTAALMACATESGGRLGAPKPRQRASHRGLARFVG
ncbi:MAG: polyprenyl synthetase family protein, partial [Ktedonobacterales bacterium]